MKKSYFLVFTLFCLGITSALAQYSILYNYNDSTSGGSATGLTLSGGKFYGTAFGGSYGHGVIFSIDTNGNGYKIIHNFNGINGESPQCLLTLAGGTLYGVANGGKFYDPAKWDSAGVIFSLDTNGSGYKVLFYFNDTNGAMPSGPLTLLGNVLYGMTGYGGVYDSGCVFSIHTDGSGYRKLIDFAGNSSAFPSGPLILSGNKLYGTGGNDIFSIDTNGSDFKIMFYFSPNDTDSLPGRWPNGLVMYANKLYGTTITGGLGWGTVFSIDTNGNGYNDLWDLNAYVTPTIPCGSLLLSSGILYGMTDDLPGDPSIGAIYSIDSNGTGFNDLWNFTDSVAPGTMPYGTLIISGNSLYGTTASGGLYNGGVIFRYHLTEITAIEEPVANTSSVTVYPNPSNGVFQIQANSHKSIVNSQIEVYTVLGEKIYQQWTMNNGQFTINLSNQPSGIYLYKIISDNGKFMASGKLVIEK
ncbi:MAG: choice-of-anchor tandem repeat GloVer-containing protein [Bacteroidia bacterium]